MCSFVGGVGIGQLSVFGRKHDVQYCLRSKSMLRLRERKMVIVLSQGLMQLPSYDNDSLAFFEPWSVRRVVVSSEGERNAVSCRSVLKHPNGFGRLGYLTKAVRGLAKKYLHSTVRCSRSRIGDFLSFMCRLWGNKGFSGYFMHPRL